MRKHIADRGPDGEGLHHDAHVARGTRPLEIINVGGGQPFCNEDRTVAAVFNGEICDLDALIQFGLWHRAFRDRLAVSEPALAPAPCRSRPVR
jgi:hypothetical protein